VRLLRLFLRFFFTHLYTTLAPGYDLVAWLVSAGQWYRWVDTALDPLPEAPVLELGHGTGHLLQELAGKDVQAIGVDRSAQMGRAACRRLAGRGRLVRAEASALPFPGGCFHTVLSTFPPEFIADPAALAEVRRVLAPGAALTVVAQALITGGALYDRLAAWLFGVTGQYSELPAGWEAPFAQAGLEAERHDVLVPRARVVRIRARRPPGA
jgi:ubiquinone/menaquinone biosynthesis C-methylase UbiE